MKVLAVIDMQKDFIDGALGTPEAQAIVPAVQARIAQARADGERVVFTRDTHHENYLQTQEGRKLPVPHCILGTDGWQIDARLEVGDAAVIDKPAFGSLELAARAALARRQDADAQAEAYRRQHLQQQGEARYHLVMARYHLAQEHIQAAEKEIWSISELPEAQQTEYLLLRGRIALRKEQFENALLYLQQAEQSGGASRYLLRELYASMEQCCREREDFKGAYEYATRQRELSESKMNP